MLFSTSEPDLPCATASSPDTVHIPERPNGDVASTSSRRGVGSETCPLTRKLNRCTGLDIRSVGYCKYLLTNVTSHFHEPAHSERITAPAQAKISLLVPKSTLRSVGGSRVTTGSNFNDSILPTAMDFSVNAKHIFPFFPRRLSLWRTPIHTKIVEILNLTTLRSPSLIFTPGPRNIGTKWPSQFRGSMLWENTGALRLLLMISTTGLNFHVLNLRHVMISIFSEVLNDS